MTNLISAEVGPYEITIDLVFDGYLYVNDELTNSANYTLSGGAYIRNVEVLDVDRLRLWSENFYGQTSFQLNISNIMDGYGDPIDVTTSVTPFYSTANIGSYNGFIRTNHSSRIITSDSQRIYLSGAKGIDVFRKGTGISKYKWAQIFDGYGINTMFVANFPTDISIVDTQAPYISYSLPGNGDVAIPETHIIAIVSDATTSIEITSLSIYVNGTIAFIGSYGGWQPGFSGNIILLYQSIGFNIWPEDPFTMDSFVTVRIIADDLLGNQMDTSYTFEISPAIPISGAWGFGPWGFAPFGGV